MKKDLLLLMVLILPAFAILFRPGFFAIHDNLQPMRQLEMAKCFVDGQIPCRWVSDMGLGYGYPLFNYYPPFPYYLGQIFRFFNLSYIDIIKAVGVVGFIVSAMFMYLLTREFWGRGGGVISALLFTYAPYHSVDFFVRGAMNEFWAMSFYPGVFWTSYRLIKKPSAKWLIGLSLSLAGLMLSHNLMLMIFTPFFVVWVLFWLFKFGTKSSFIFLIPSGLLALGLAAFFTIPVLFEQKYVHVETLTVGYFNYLQHFLDLDQLFLHIYWGYGSSGLGQRTMSFALGYLHWIIPVFLIIPTLFLKILKQYRSMLLLLFTVLFCSLFMTHWKSTFVWQRLPFLAYLQFPWRFLTLSVFFASFISGALNNILNKRTGLFIIASLATLLLWLNADYFHPSHWWPAATDNQLFSGSSWLTLSAASIYDYLPKGASQPPADPAGSEISLQLGSGSYLTLSKKSDYQNYHLNILTPDAVVQLQTFYFPGWQFQLDGKTVSFTLDKLFGRPQITVPFGEHTLTARFTSTPVRRVSDITSAASWVLLLGIIILWMLSRLLGISIWPRSKPDLSQE